MPLITRTHRRQFLWIIALAALLPGSLMAQRLHLVSPNGGESLKAGRMTTIQWSGVRSEEDSVRLQYSLDGGTTWRMIAETAGDSSYQWEVPYTSGASCLMRIEQITGAFSKADTVVTIPNDQWGGLIRISQDDSKVMMCSGLQEARIWDVQTGALLFTIPSTSQIYANDINPDGSRVVLTERSDFAVMYEVSTQQELFRVGFAEHRGSVEAVRFTHDGTKFVAASRNGSIKRIDAMTGVTNDSVDDFSVGDFHNATFLDISPNDSLILAGGYYLPDAHIWNLITKDKVAVLLHPTNKIYSGVFHPNGKWVITTSDSVRVWDIETESIIKVLPATSGPNSGVAITPDGRLIAAWSPSSNVLQLWDLEKGSLAHTIPHQFGLQSAAISHNGRWLGTQQKSTGGGIIWNLYNSDTSDAAWSILGSGVEVTDIDLGRSKVGEQKDSTLTSFIRNTGTEPFSVNELRLVGGQSGEFGVISGGAPFEIPAGGMHEVGFSFNPVGVGVRSATVEIITMNDTIRVAIRGEGYKVVTGVAEGERGEGAEGIAVEIYPNPVRGVATVTWSGGRAGEGPVHVVLRDVLGREVSELTLVSASLRDGAGRVEVDLGTVPIGEYYVEVRVGRGRAVVPMIVIR